MVVLARVLMGMIQDRHGTYYVQRRVPKRLQEAVARILNADEPRRVFLKKSLGTKDPKVANAAAPHVLADFNRIIGEAEALLKEQPAITALTDVQIKRMAESYYATMLADDEEERREGTGSELCFRASPSSSLRRGSNTGRRGPWAPCPRLVCLIVRFTSGRTRSNLTWP